MSLSALRSVVDAFEATKRFLVPFDRARWFRLAVVVLFVAGVGLGVPSVPGGGIDTSDPDPGPDTGAQPDPELGSLTPTLTTELLILIVGFVLLALLVALLWWVASATMEFVFVASLRDETVRLRTSFLENWRRGARLFLFRLSVWLLLFGTAGFVTVATGVVVGGWPPTEWGGGAALAAVLVAVLAFSIVAVVNGLVLWFTRMFVVPVMLLEERGVLSAWRRFWPTLTGEPAEYAVYAVVGFLLGIVVGIPATIVTVLAVAALAIPFAVVGTPLALLFVLAFVAVAFVAVLLVKVPVQVFLRYYALFVLGDTNPAFDAVPDARAAVRTDGGDDDAGFTGGPPGPGGGGSGPGHGGSGPGLGGPGTGRDTGTNASGRGSDGPRGPADDRPSGSSDDGPGDGWPDSSDDDRWDVDRDDR